MTNIKTLALAFFAVAFTALFLTLHMFEHGVEFVVLGGADVRFQYADGQPMSNADIRVLRENMRPITTLQANGYGVFNYEEYFGTAASLEVRHNNSTVRFILPDVLPRVVYNDRGERIEVVVSAGSGGRLSAASLGFIYIGAAVVSGYVVFLIIKRKQGRNSQVTGTDIAQSRRMPKYSGF